MPLQVRIPRRRWQPKDSTNTDASGSSAVDRPHILRPVAAAEAIWTEAHRGLHYPAAWRGKLSMTDGYQVLLKILDRYVRPGVGLAGWTVGLTAEAIQRQIGIHEPVLTCSQVSHQ